MTSKLVTCPESAHLETITYQETTFGILVDTCTRFRAGCPMTCSRSCAARQDRLQRDDDTGDFSVGDSTSVEVRLPDR